VTIELRSNAGEVIRLVGCQRHRRPLGGIDPQIEGEPQHSRELTPVCSAEVTHRHR